jgi:CheY-like chemotaxis protein
MKLLLIEDDKNKTKNICTFLKDAIKDIDITCARSYQSGLEQVMTANFDLLLLDMSLSTYDIDHQEDGFQYDAFAGKHILFEMVRKKIKIKTIVITQFETFGQGKEIITLNELTAQLSASFPDVFIGTVFYSASESDWQLALEKLIP